MITMYAVIGLLVVGGVAFSLLIVKQQFRHDDKLHNGTAGGTRRDAGEAERTAGANDAFLRKVKRTAAARGLAVILPDPAKSAFAAVLVGPAGVLGVFADDHCATVYGSGEAVWAQISGGVRREFPSPAVAAEQARRALRETVNAGKLRPFALNAKAVMTSGKAELVIPRNVGVSTEKEFLRWLQTSAEPVADKKVDVPAVEKFLRGALEA